MESIEEWLKQPGRLAHQLRALRKQAELSGEALAEACGWVQSKVSKIETGKRLPKRADVEAWVTACGGGKDAVAELLGMWSAAQVAHTTFQERMRHGQVSVQEDYLRLAERAHLIRYVDSTLVPGLLQIPAYARAVLAVAGAIGATEVDDVDAAVAVRMERQLALYDQGKRFEFLMSERVLLELVCPPEVMLEQLDRLQSAASLERVRLGVVPLGVQTAATPSETFQIHVTGDETVVTVEGWIIEDRSRGEAAEKFVRLADRLWEEAVEGAGARRLIAAAVAHLREERRP